MAELKLVADLGGTHLRMGLAERVEGTLQLRAVEVIESRTVSDFTEALAAYWCRQSAPALAAVAVAVAGPVDGQGLSASARLTNVDLAVSAQTLSHFLAVSNVQLVNDFAAIAMATPLLSDADLRLHGAQSLPPDETTLVLGPGTGLGVAAWLAGGRIVAGEGGHARLCAPDAAAGPVWGWLYEKYDFVSAEHVLSGRGLLALYQGVAALRGLAADASDPAAVWKEFGAGHPAAQEAVWHFTTALGSYAGDLALIFGAKSVLLAGGILPRWGEGFDTNLFRTAFEAKETAYQARLAAVPSATVIHPYPALLGLAL